MKNVICDLKQHIDTLLETGNQVIIAIDGNCTAGKTTLAAELEKAYDCNLFHMDDFFLRPEQRTPERFAQPGGNVDYERFREEVLIPLKGGVAFSYRPFSCRTFTLSDAVTVLPKKLNIVEGTYSLHPYFGDPHLHDRFFHDWIPMEQQYFDHFQIPEHCDLVLDRNL